MLTTVPSLFLRVAEVLTAMSDRRFRRFCMRSGSMPILFRGLYIVLEASIKDLEHGKLSQSQRVKLKALSLDLFKAMQKGPIFQVYFGEFAELIDLLGRCAYAKAIDMLEVSSEKLIIPIHASYFEDLHEPMVRLDALVHSVLQDDAIETELSKMRESIDLFSRLLNRVEHIRS